MAEREYTIETKFPGWPQLVGSLDDVVMSMIDCGASLYDYGNSRFVFTHDGLTEYFRRQTRLHDVGCASCHWPVAVWVGGDHVGVVNIK